MKNPLLAFTLLLVLGCADAQIQVSMTPHNDLLKPILGFSYNNCVVDMNNDGLDDVVRVTDNGMYIDYQQNDGSFTQSFFGITFQSLPTWSICAGDLDNNGYNDLLFASGGSVSFVSANPNGTGYSESLMPDFIFSQRSTFADIDNDGHLDAFVCHDVDVSHPYRNDGNGNLTLDQGLIVTADRPGNYSAIWTDYDNDNDIDLYITKCKAGALPGDIDRDNLLYRNNGNGTYTEVGAAAGVDDNAQSWTTVFDDFDNDGDFDAFVVNHDFQNRFFRNNGDGTFTDIIEATGIAATELSAWEAASGDFNNDGWLDILSEFSNSLYLNSGNGLHFIGQQLPVNSGGIGDLNNDGFLDVVREGTVYLNDGNGNNWLKVNTIGMESNRSGIGARVALYGPWGRQTREVRSGQSFRPMSSLTTFFGIGQAAQIDSVVVTWPSGTRTVLPNPAINTTLNIHEYSCLLPSTQIIVSGSTALCPMQTVELTLPGTWAGIEWSNQATTPSITVSEPGNYSAVLTDGAGCVSYAEGIAVSAFVEDAPNITVSEGQSTFCTGGLVVLSYNGSGTNPVWSTGETSASITVEDSGNYFVSTTPACPGEPLVSVPLAINVLDATPPTAAVSSTAPDGSVLLTATGPSPAWYDAPVGGTLLGTGNTFQAPPLGQPTTYYVEAHHFYPGEIQYGGKPDNSGAGSVPLQSSYNFFDAWEPFTLMSVVAYVPVTGATAVRTVQLYDGSGALVAEKSFNIGPGIHELALNFEVPVGTNLSLRCPQGSFFRNTSTAVSLPYPIGTVGEIKNDALGNGYYYYFYNWKVQRQNFECISERVGVTATVSSSQGSVLPTEPVHLFPNPTNSHIAISSPAWEGKQGRCCVYDALGREVKTVLLGSVPDRGFHVEMGGSPAGRYLAVVFLDGMPPILQPFVMLGL